MRVKTEFCRDSKEGSLRLFNKAIHMKKFLSTVPISNTLLTMLVMCPAVVDKSSVNEQYVDSASLKKLCPCPQVCVACSSMFISDEIAKLGIIQCRLDKSNGELIVQTPICMGMRFCFKTRIGVDAVEDIEIDAIQNKCVLEPFSLGKVPISLSIFGTFLSVVYDLL